MPKDKQQPESDSTPPLDKRISFRISRLNARLNSQAARLLKKSADVSLSQWRMLVVIERLGTASASEIVRHTRLDKALVSRTIKSLSDAGLVAVDVDSGDLRAHRIRMTQEGLARFQQALPEMLNRQRTMADTLTQQELDLLFDMISRLELSIDEMDGNA